KAHAHYRAAKPSGAKQRKKKIHMKIEHWLLIVFAFLMGAFGQVPRPQSNYQQRSNQTAPNSQQIPALTTADQASRDVKVQASYAKKLWDFNMADVTGFVVAIVTIMLAVIARRQSQLVSGQNNLIDRQNKIMEEQTELTKRQIHLVQNIERGYIVPKNLTVN